MDSFVAYKDMDITYGELAKALSQLGYQNKSHNKVFLYINGEYDSIIALPLKKETEIVRKVSFASFSYIMYMQGVIEHRDDLAKMIEKKRLAKQQATA